MFEDRNGNDLIAAIVRELQREPVADPGARARIMAAVQREVPGGRFAAAWRWLRAPRTIRLSPLGGLALAVGLVGIVIAASLSAASTRERAVATASGAAVASPSSPERAPATPVRMVQFVLVAPSASRVSLVGDFNGWDHRATPLRAASARGVWAVEVPLSPGRHVYAFVVDDSTWVPDPAAPRAPGDDFGAPSSVIVVGGSAT